jgi:hypothetical protein
MSPLISFPPGYRHIFLLKIVRPPEIKWNKQKRAIKVNVKGAKIASDPKEITLDSWLSDW